MNDIKKREYIIKGIAEDLIINTKEKWKTVPFGASNRKGYKRPGQVHDPP